jgi:hypothetical protein
MWFSLSCVAYFSVINYLFRLYTVISFMPKLQVRIVQWSPSDASFLSTSLVLGPLNFTFPQKPSQLSCKTSYTVCDIPGL